MWNCEDLPRPTRELDLLKSDLAAFGYCMIERALEGEALAAVRTRLAEQAAAERARHNHKNPANRDPVTQWVGMLLNKGDAFFGLVEHPIVTALVEHVLGPDYLISCVDSQIQHPGSGLMPMHTDQWWMPSPAIPGVPTMRPSTIARGDGAACDPAPAEGPISPPMVVNVMWMITDFAEENGATRLVPGSHLSGAQPDPSVPHKMASVPALGRAGTAFAIDGRLWHAAGANASGTARYGITTNFCAPQCRPLENYTRGMRPEVLARCPSHIREHLGFAAWSSYGHTGDPEARFSAPGEEALGELRGG